MWRISLLLNAGVILCTLMSYLSASSSPHATWIFYFFGLAYPWLFLANFCFILFWWWRKKRFWLYSFLTLIIGWSNFGKFFGTAIFDGSKEKNTLKIMSYNCSAFSKKSKESINEFLTESNPDFLCLQEFVETTNQIKAFSNKYPFLKNYYIAHPAEKAITIFSKYPIIQTAFLNFNTNNNDVLWADVNVNGKIIRIYSAHLLSNSVSERTTNLIQNREVDKEAAQTSRQVLGQVRKCYKIRTNQAINLKKHIQSSPYPVIVCGDFNDTPQTYTYSTIAENLLDTWQQKGFGLGSTYAGAIPLLRIDYILASQNFKTVNCDILKNIDYSDHYPITALISWK